MFVARVRRIWFEVLAGWSRLMFDFRGGWRGKAGSGISRVARKTCVYNVVMNSHI